jgi:hypothetical protein
MNSRNLADPPTRLPLDLCEQGVPQQGQRPMRRDETPPSNRALRATSTTRREETLGVSGSNVPHKLPPSPRPRGQRLRLEIRAGFADRIPALECEHPGSRHSHRGSIVNDEDARDPSAFQETCLATRYPCIYRNYRIMQFPRGSRRDLSRHFGGGDSQEACKNYPVARKNYIRAE